LDACLLGGLPLCPAQHLLCQWLGATETEPNGTATETRRDPCPWHASEACIYTSHKGDDLLCDGAPGPELVEVERMIKIR
jgi:hypothetical protein